MSAMIHIFVDGTALTVPLGTSVAAALTQAGLVKMRSSVSGEPRGALCGMGICFECRVVIDGAPHQLSCQRLCAEGMEVRTT